MEPSSLSVVELLQTRTDSIAVPPVCCTRAVTGALTADVPCAVCFAAVTLFPKPQTGQSYVRIVIMFDGPLYTASQLRASCENVVTFFNLPVLKVCALFLSRTPPVT